MFNNSLFFRNRDKLLRCKQSARRVPPAEKSFCAGQTFPPIHLRLEIYRELASFNAPAQVVLQNRPCFDKTLHLYLEHAYCAATCHLGAIEGQIGMFETIVNGFLIPAKQRDADAGAAVVFGLAELAAATEGGAKL